jgi:small subunit ribosomal protein S5
VSPIRKKSTKKFNKSKGKRRSHRKYDRKVVDIRRVAKVRAGARRLRFSSMVVVGDRKGRVGVAIGRAADTRSSIEKAAKKAEKRMVKIDLIGDTIPHRLEHKYGAAEIMIKPAGPGTGVIASNAIRSVMELAGVRNVLTKQLGSQNPVTNTYCVFEALKKLDKTRIIRKMKERAKAQEASKKEKKEDKNNGTNKKGKGKKQSKKTEEPTEKKSKKQDNK